MKVQESYETIATSVNVFHVRFPKLSETGAKSPPQPLCEIGVLEQDWYVRFSIGSSQVTQK